MGDETFYQSFLLNQIGNYLRNLVFHLGSKDGQRDILPIVPFKSDWELPWNLVFHLGSQMGDEAFYQPFLFIQIRSYLWNLVFHLCSPDG